MRKKVIFLLLLILTILPLSKVFALSVDEKNYYVEKGESSVIELYANSDVNLTSISFTLTFSTYDVPVTFDVKNGYKDTINASKHTITFDHPISGKIQLGTLVAKVKAKAEETTGSALLSKVTGKTEDGKDIKLNNLTVNIFVGTKEEVQEKEIDHNMLSRIDSKLVNIPLENDKFDYEISIYDTVKELDLNPILKDNSCTVTTSSQVISNLPEDSNILITTNCSGVEQVYKVHVDVKPAVEEIEIDEPEEDFEETTKKKSDFEYKWMYIVILCMLIPIILGVNIIDFKKK